VARATGPRACCSSGEFGVGAAVLEQRIRLKVGVVDRGLTRATRAVRTRTKPIEGPVDVVQRGFDLGHTLVGKFTHPTNLPAATIAAAPGYWVHRLQRSTRIGAKLALVLTL
jgi:hypothetical protein